jgi:hypothetical protein
VVLKETPQEKLYYQGCSQSSWNLRNPLPLFIEGWIFQYWELTYKAQITQFALGANPQLLTDRPKILVLTLPGFAVENHHGGRHFSKRRSPTTSTEHQQQRHHNAPGH